MRLNGEEFKEVNEFMYPGSTVLSGGEMKVKVSHRLVELTRMKGHLDRLQRS